MGLIIKILALEWSRFWAWIAEWLSPWSGCQLFWIIWRRWSRSYQLWYWPQLSSSDSFLVANYIFLWCHHHFLATLSLHSDIKNCHHTSHACSMIALKKASSCSWYFDLFSTEHCLNIVFAPSGVIPFDYKIRLYLGHHWDGQGWDVDMIDFTFFRIAGTHFVGWDIL